MLDPKFIRQNQEKVREALKKRNDSFDFDAFLKLEAERRQLLGKIEELKSIQNKIDTDVKVLLKKKLDPQAKIEESKRIKLEMSALNEHFSGLDAEF